MEQKSAEWFEARKGLITGSRIGAILGVSPYKTRDDVLREMVREHLGLEREFKGNAATDHGERMEPVALEWYSASTGTNVEPTGFVVHDHHPFLGASPDGLVGMEGGLEIKCPYWAKVPYSINEKPYYWAQMQLVMEVCDLEWMDFVCYIDPESTLIERVVRDRSWFAEVLPELETFHQEYLETIADEGRAKDIADGEGSTLDDERATRLSELHFEIAELDSRIAPLKSEFDALKK